MPSAIELDLWYTALGSPHGIEIETNDAERAKQRLYVLRKKASDPDLDCLSIMTFPDRPNILWIVKRTT